MRARPGYPPQLFADLAQLAHIGPGSRVLEIGCGTGQATVPLAERGGEIVAVEAQECYERWDPETPTGGIRLPRAANVPARSDELDRSGRFGPPVFCRYEWEQSYPTAAYLDLLRTYSGHRALEPRARTNLLDCIARLIDARYGGSIRKAYLTELRIAYRRGE